MQSTTSLNPESPSYSQSLTSEVSTVTPSNLTQTLTTDTMTSKTVLENDFEKGGFRAAEAFVRPAPINIHGILVGFGFDLRNCTFTLNLTAPTSTKETAPTEIFLPEWHFPGNDTSVEVSGGKWAISIIDDKQTLRWWHAEGEQKITVKGLKQKLGMIAGTDDDDGYLRQYQQQICPAM